MQNPEQLLLDLGHRTALGREDFLIASGNEDAVAWIDLWPDWPAPVLVLHGPPACGKTHLASVWREKAGASWLSSSSLLNLCVNEFVSQKKNLVIDGADERFGETEYETAVFHLYNIFREQGLFLLVTMRRAPVRQPFILKDLASRLRAAPAAGILAPDDCLLTAVLVKMFADRQLRISSEVIEYIMPRIERSFDNARLLVETADRIAMQKKRPVSVPLMREVLQVMDENQNEAAASSGEER
jgi:chromosomal replication initiation ATPase DnaA